MTVEIIPQCDVTQSRNDELIFKHESKPRPQLLWDENTPAAINYQKLGNLLSQLGDLYRQSGDDNGLVLIRTEGMTKSISTAAELAPLIVDRIDVSVFHGDKSKGTRLPNSHLAAMLKTEAFLSCFRVMDGVTSVPLFLPDFTATEPGYNDAGSGHRYIHVGERAEFTNEMDCVNAFLDVMDFASPADRVNALAAALTVMLSNHWPGGKPIILATATKSHSGKDTVIAFAAGITGQCSISYQGTDWALERALVGAINFNPDARLIVVENARLERRGTSISSAILERFATDPNPFLFSTGTGTPRRRRNDFILAISTNFGMVSEDILNRSLPIHLNPKGHVAERNSPIGNPKLEFLPKYRTKIAAELRGMIHRWKIAGMPPDYSIRHPFSEWASTVGGILKANGIDGFLGNYAKRRVADDPLRSAIGRLGSSFTTGEWYRLDDLAREVSNLGISKTLIPTGDQETFESRKRGLGVVLSTHADEVFHVETESELLKLRLEKGRKRFDGEAPHTRYRFVVLDRFEQVTD